MRGLRFGRTFVKNRSTKRWTVATIPSTIEPEFDDLENATLDAVERVRLFVDNTPHGKRPNSDW